MGLTDNPELMRTLAPKITPQAAARMYTRNLTSIAVTTGTLGMLWWQAYLQTWTEVMFPSGGRK